MGFVALVAFVGFVAFIGFIEFVAFIEFVEFIGFIAFVGLKSLRIPDDGCSKVEQYCNFLPCACQD